MQPRVKDIANRLNALVGADGPTTDCILSFLCTILDEWNGLSHSQEKRRLALALERFYGYLNKQTDLEFEPWLELRQKGQA